MSRFPIKNRAFDRIGNSFSPVIDHDHFLGMTAFDIPYRKQPRVNLKRSGSDYEMQLSVPGFKKEELTVEVKDDRLVVVGEKRKNDLIQESDFILEEFGFEHFRRTFKLSPTVSKDTIRAKHEDGILHLFFSELKEEEIGESHMVPVE